MGDKPTAVNGDVLFSQFEPTSFFGKVLKFPLVRLFVALLFLMPVGALNSIIVFLVIENLSEPAATHVDFVRLIVTFPLLILSYRFYCRRIEGREAFEFGFGGAIPEALAGVLVGAGLVGATVAVMVGVGAYSITSFNGAYVLMFSIVLFGTGALMQEIIIRLLIFRLTEEMVGTWAGIVVASIIFGVMHMANPNQSLLSAFTLIVTSFMLFGAFVLTRRIWLVWGIHFGWNMFQAGVLGMPNSGVTFPGWITPEIDDPAWLTGGSIGIENSAVAVGITVVLSAFFIAAVIKRGQALKPMWRR